MKKYILSSLLLALFLTACSSQSRDSKSEAEFVATEVCEGAKKGNISAMIQYSSDSAKPQLEALDKVLQTSLKNPDVKKAYMQAIQKMDHVDCTTSNSLQRVEDGSFLVSNSQTKQFYKLREVDGLWQVFLLE